MKFKDRWPDVKPGQEVKDTGIVRSNKCNKCWTCQEQTDWIDLDYQAYFCSDECISILEGK